MTDEESLLAAIRLRQADDLPRLVYADWLDEHNKPKRAEFIRVQVRDIPDAEAAVCIASPRHMPAAQDELDALRRREQELLWEHGLGWIPEVNGWCAHTWAMGPGLPLRFGLRKGPAEDQANIEVEFRRGFPAVLRGHLAVFWGRECELCRGEGGWSGGPGCPDCNGYGRIPGPTPALVKLVREHPIERVVVTDRSPSPWYPDADLHDPGPQDGWFWRRGDRVVFDNPDIGPYNAYLLPDDLYDRLKGGRLRSEQWHVMRHMNGRDRIYEKVEDAQADLSDALLAEAAAP